MTITLKELVDLRDALMPVFAAVGPIKVYDSTEPTRMRNLTTDEVVEARLQFLSLDTSVKGMLSATPVNVTA